MACSKASNYDTQLHFAVNNITARLREYTWDAAEETRDLPVKLANTHAIRKCIK